MTTASTSCRRGDFAAEAVGVEGEDPEAVGPGDSVARFPWQAHSRQGLGQVRFVIPVFVIFLLLSHLCFRVYFACSARHTDTSGAARGRARVL